MIKGIMAFAIFALSAVVYADDVKGDGGDAAIAYVGDVLGIDAGAGAEGVSCHLVGEVIHASRLRENLIVIVEPGKASFRGVATIIPDGVALSSGDIVEVEGETTTLMRHAAIRASRIRLVSHGKLPEARQGKFVDARNNRLHLRRVSMRGVVSDIVIQSEGEARRTVFRLRNDRSYIECRLRGELPARYCDIGEVMATGVVFSRYDDAGALALTSLELESIADITLLDASAYWWRIASYALMSVVAALAVFLVYLLLRIRRAAITAKAIASERRRMASDLHDTLEQNVAGVKMLITAALKIPGVPDASRTLLTQAATLLGHAKSEVRHAVMDLRSDGASSLTTRLEELARQLEAQGSLRVRTRLHGAVDAIAPSIANDIVLIAREAVANAIKHGKPKNIAILAELRRSGFSFSQAKDGKNPVLHVRILNDGEPFEPASAPGPALGHFGLVGMTERAKRSGIRLSFESEGRWVGWRIEVPND